MERFSKSYVDFKKFKPQKKSGGLFGFFKSKNDARPAAESSFIRKTNVGSIANRERARMSWRKIIVFSTLAAIVVTWFALMLYLPFFRINTITINGLRLINHDEIQNYINDKYIKSGYWPKNNYFLVNPKKISADIASKYAVNKVEIKKIFSHEIQINIEEKITSIIYDNGQNYYLLDGEGTVVKVLTGERGITATSTELSTVISTTTTSTTTLTTSADTHKPNYLKFTSEYYGLPMFYDARRLNVHENQTNVLPANLIKSIIDWKQALKNDGVGEVHYFTSNNPTAGLTAILSRPWSVMVQPTNDMAAQLQNLKTILTNSNIKPTEYIDLRFEERVFWK
jgi:hypothetical protein